MFTLNARFVRFHVRVMNFFARAFGVMSVIVGIAFIATAVIGTRDVAMFAIVGAVSVAIGVAFLVVKPLTPDHIYAISDLMGLPRPGSAEKTGGSHDA